MRVVQLDFEDPGAPARLVERRDPPLPGPGWSRVAVSGGGICGSDLHIFAPGATGPPTALYSYGTLPMELGHEIAGTVVETSGPAPFPVGARVAVDPVLTCAARLHPLCDRCAAGAASTCRSLGSKAMTEGMGVGFTNGLGGGWGDSILAHDTQLHALPPAIEGWAETLPEPLSIAVHGLLRVPPREGPVLVIGAGIVGLLAVVTLRALFPELEVFVIAKHPHQIDAAQACGAHGVVELTADVYGALAEAAHTTVRGGGADAMLTAGFPYVVEAVGSEVAVGQAFRSVDSRGTVLLLGASGVSTVDMSPVWFKEATVTGSFCHAYDAHPVSGDPVHSFDVAIDLLASATVPSRQLVTHEFRLDDWETAVEVAMARDAGAIKVVLRPG